MWGWEVCVYVVKGVRENVYISFHSLLDPWPKTKVSRFENEKRVHKGTEDNSKRLNPKMAVRKSTDIPIDRDGNGLNTERFVENLFTKQLVRSWNHRISHSKQLSSSLASQEYKSEGPWNVGLTLY